MDMIKLIYLLEKANDRITIDVENILLDIFSDNPTLPLTVGELVVKVKTKLPEKYKNVNVDAHVNWALDMMHANNLIKRVGPATWEAVEGPDDVYSQRATGHAGEGEFANRGKNFTGSSGSMTRQSFNQQYQKALTSAKLLKSAGFSQSDAEKAMLNAGGFHSVAVKAAVKMVYKMPTGNSPADELGAEDVKDLFGVEI